MKINKYDFAIGALIIVEIILSVYLGMFSYSSSGDFFCGIGTNCEDVQNSIYGSLFGIKLAWLGAICFSILFILFLIARVNKRLYWMFFVASIIGAISAIYFIYIQAFVLGQYCRDCLIIDGIMVIMLVIILFEFIDFRKEIKKIEKSAESVIRKAL